MNLDALWNAPPVFVAHALAAIFAFFWGGVLLLLPKGTPRHKFMGRIWVAAMAIVVVTSIFIPRFGAISYIHIFTVTTAISLPYAIIHVRKGNVRSHAIAMVSVYVGALIIAGAFTFLPGRIMHAVVFGGEPLTYAPKDKR